MLMTAHKVMRIFEEFRMAPSANDQFEIIGKAKLLERFLPFMVLHQPIKFSIMGFPMKSPNDRDKVLGVLPDLAEKATLDNFAEFNRRVKEVYAPGITLAIVSDGYAFSDLMQVSDKVVEQYQDVLMDWSKDLPFNWYNIKDFFGKDLSVDAMRKKLMTQFGISHEELTRRILMDADVNTLYRGMIKFMNLDLAIRDYSSNSQLQKNAKITAREMMFRNEAYSALVQSELGNHIRLSMHPSINNGVKYSFQLINSPKAWTSAWHCAVAIGDDGLLETIHKKDAVAAGYELVYENGQPFYFTH